jgi:hypothetical protein
MIWLMLGICVIGFLVAVRTCCCSLCHLLCTPGTEPTGSITVTLPALVDNAGGACATCADFADAYILDRLATPTELDPCLITTFSDSCVWGLVISPPICDVAGVADEETILVTLNGSASNQIAVQVKLCFANIFETGDISWSGTYAETLPMDCTTLGTKLVPWIGTELEAYCTTADDATVEF